MTVAQLELNKKLEAEIVKIGKDVEEANIASESVLSNLKRKQGDAVLEMLGKIDALAQMKAKIEKGKQIIMAEIHHINFRKTIKISFHISSG